MKQMKHDFSLCALTGEGMAALAYGLVHHIATKIIIKKNALFTELEQLFQNLF